MWKTLSSKTIFEHPRLTLIEDEVELPNGTKTTYLRFDDKSPGAMSVIAEREDGKILLQKEYSYPNDQMLYHFPGGHIHPGEDPAIAANREFMEEAHLYANDLTFLGWYFFNDRRHKAKTYVYHATNLVEKYLKGDEEETIEQHWFTREEITEMIQKNEILNIYVLAGWSMFNAKNNS